MAARTSMATLITRVRLLIADPAGGSQTFADNDIQDILDASRINLRNVSLAPSPTFSGATISYLDYYSDLTDWEDDIVLKQFLITIVTPTTSENIPGHWTFTNTTLPPVYATEKSYDVYRAAADLLERWAAVYVRRFTFTSDSQSFQISNVTKQLQELAHTYRGKQRAMVINATRSDTVNKAAQETRGLGPLEIDRMSSGG